MPRPRKGTNPRRRRILKVERGGKEEGNGKPDEKPDEVQEFDSFGALDDALDVKPEGLADTYDFLRLLGAVAGQIALLDVATNCSDPKAQASAARALIQLKEKPEHIVERLRSSRFNSLNTKDLHTIVQDIRRGKDPKIALQACLDAKEG